MKTFLYTIQVLLIFGCFNGVYLKSESVETKIQEAAKNLTDEGNSNLTSTNSWVRLLFPKTFSEKRTKRYVIWATRNDVTNASAKCSSGSSAEDYPNFISARNLENGAIIVCFLIGIYCFTLLAIICDKYFLPCVERICEALNLSQDVAAATFMSVATTTPELFVNIIGTFITESDLGIGTVVGSSLFNALGVAAIGGLAASSPIQLHWWPLTRDCILYVISVILLIVLTWDGMIFWYEGLILFAVYFVYFNVMFQNARINGFVQRIYRKFRRDNKIGDLEKTNAERVSVAVVSSYGSYAEETTQKYIESKVLENTVVEDQESNKSLCRFPVEGTTFQKLFFVYSWPLKLLLVCTIPNPVTYPKLFPVTFICCIFWIGINSYIVSWMIALIGNMFEIPDAVLGMTFLAAGGCLPEAISITIMSRRGEGSMGVSNSLGANTMNILLSLGMPWFLKSIIMGMDDSAFIRIQSGSIEYTIASLILVALALYAVLYLNDFQLRKRTGILLMCIYCLFIVLAILSEMIFFAQDCD